jgi:hypothetical protein
VDVINSIVNEKVDVIIKIINKEDVINSIINKKVDVINSISNKNVDVWERMLLYKSLKCGFFPPSQVHVHRRGSDNLLNIIPARILPKEYGGEAGSLHDLWGKDLNVLSDPSTHSLTLSTKLNLFYTALVSFRSAS